MLGFWLTVSDFVESAREFDNLTKELGEAFIVTAVSTPVSAVSTIEGWRSRTNENGLNSLIIFGDQN